MHTCFAYNIDIFNNNNIDYKKQILSAIANENLQKISNYLAIAKKYNLMHTTLW